MLKTHHRIERLQEEIRHRVSSILLFEATDPAIKGVTVTRVLLTKDLGVARVYYECDARSKEGAIQEALERARGFIRKNLAPQLNLKAVPQLEFFYDETKDEISKVEGLFSKL